MSRYKLYSADGKYWKWMNLNPSEVRHLKKIFGGKAHVEKSKNQRTKRRHSPGTYIMGIRID